MTSRHNKKDAYRTHLENCESALWWIARLGGAHTRQLARLIWPDANCGMRMAQRTIQALLRAQLVLKRPLPNGGALYVLSQRGACTLREDGYAGVSARGQRDLTFAKPRHRLLANEFALDLHLNGYTVWTEFEVQRGVVPVPRIIVNRQPKIPDAIAQAMGEFVWIEVENAYKSQSRLWELVIVAKRILSPSKGYFVSKDMIKGRYNRMTFLATEMDRLFDVFRRLVDGVERDFIDLDVLQKIEFVYAEMSSGYVWHGIVGTKCASEIYLRWQSRKTIKQSLQLLFDDWNISSTGLSRRDLWQLFGEIVPAINMQLSVLDDLLGVEIDDYSDLHSLAPDAYQHLSDRWFVDFIEGIKEEWVKKNTDLTKQLFFDLMTETGRP